MIVTYTIIAFVCMLIPTIHQLIFGFKPKDRAGINKIGMRSATMQMVAAAIGYVLFSKIEGANPKLIVETGMLFLVSVGLVVVIQHLLLTLKQGKL